MEVPLGIARMELLELLSLVQFSYDSSRGRGNRDTKICSHCGVEGHTVDYCYDLHGRSSAPPRYANHALTSDTEAPPLLLLIHTNLKSYFNLFILPSIVTIPFDNYHLREGVSLSWPIFTSGMTRKSLVSVVTGLMSIGFPLQPAFKILHSVERETRLVTDP
ncbi:hypothetical protein Salat_2782400 [Sesamum alatum]|uniref:Uncharacterized protein n=1 Tax=Sesamum alatum TaxID=300844 RepID=A0AAE1XKU8_9LAMI|nr:hypothetical protein Salat_2782400 [Sesamum alatum]